MEPGHRTWGDPLVRMSFASDDFPAHLDDQARYEAWRDVFLSTYVPVEADRLNDRPFHARYDCAQLSTAGVGQLSSTVYRFARTPRAVAQFADDRFTLLGNRGPLVMSAMVAGRTTELAPGAFTMVNNTDPGEVRSPGGISVWQSSCRAGCCVRPSATLTISSRGSLMLQVPSCVILGAISASCWAPTGSATNLTSRLASVQPSLIW
jgi:hypothetical protein